MAQCLVGSLLLSLGPGAQGLVVPSKSLFPWGFSVLLLAPQVGKSLWALGLLHQCKNLFDIIVLQSGGRLLCGSVAGITAPPPRGSMPHAPPPRSPWKAPGTRASAGDTHTLEDSLVQSLVVLFEPSGCLWQVGDLM